MSEIYEALRDAERQKGAASRRPDAIPAPIDTPGPRQAGSPDVDSEGKPSLVRGLRGQLERFRSKGSVSATPLGLAGAAPPVTEAEATEVSAPDAVAPAPLSLQPGQEVALDLLRELAALEARFVALSEQLPAAADELRSGRPGAAHLGIELAACQEAFEVIRKRAIEIAPSPALAEKAVSPSTALNDLLAVIQGAMEAERQRRQFEETRRRAAAELERVLRLVRGEGGAFPPLEECQKKARELVTRLAEAKYPESPEECGQLAERRHAFSRLLDLVERGDGLSDEDWETAEGEVSSSFGKPLAVAVTRGRLRVEAGGGTP